MSISFFEPADLGESVVLGDFIKGLRGPLFVLQNSEDVARLDTLTQSILLDDVDLVDL